MRTTRLRTIVVVAAAAALLGAGCGGGDDSANGDDGDGADGDTVDSCSLLTDEEVSALAGDELVAGEGTSSICPYIPPGADVADVILTTAERAGDAMSIAEAAFPNADSITAVDDVGADTVAVTDPSGGAIGAILTVREGRVVELNVIFLSIDPGDSEGIRAAAEVAVLALDRLTG
jgi:hypothetical protein